MFVQPPTSRRARRTALAASFVLHAVVVYFLVRPPRPIFVTPSEVAFGHGGTSTELVYLAQQGASSAQSSDQAPEKRPLAYHAVRPRKVVSAKSANIENNAPPLTQAAARAGTPFGSLAQGPATGHDVRPALPVIFPNPDILPWQIPSGVEGNVIVEVTIDAQGNVTETRVLQGLGHGIEEKVVAALRNWRFRPAMMDGRAIPSQQDVYFHFPT